ncbi:MAG: hypothetical protein LH624_01435 [Cryobacterium sp.]|nr:hypothetical protein [Cryobacterium sp.]
MNEIEGNVGSRGPASNIEQLLRECPTFPVIGLAPEVVAVRTLGRVSVRGVRSEVALQHTRIAVGNGPSEGSLEAAVLKTSTLYAAEEDDIIRFVLRTQWRTLLHVHRFDDADLVESETTVMLNRAARPAATLSGSRASVGVVVVSPEYLLRLTLIDRSDFGELPLTRLPGVTDYLLSE